MHSVTSVSAALRFLRGSFELQGRQKLYLDILEALRLLGNAEGCCGELERSWLLVLCQTVASVHGDNIIEQAQKSIQPPAAKPLLPMHFAAQE